MRSSTCFGTAMSVRAVMFDIPDLRISTQRVTLTSARSTFSRSSLNVSGCARSCEAHAWASLPSGPPESKSQLSRDLPVAFEALGVDVGTEDLVDETAAASVGVPLDADRIDLVSSWHGVVVHEFAHVRIEVLTTPTRECAAVGDWDAEGDEKPSEDLLCPVPYDDGPVSLGEVLRARGHPTSSEVVPSTLDGDGGRFCRSGEDPTTGVFRAPDECEELQRDVVATALGGEYCSECIR